MLLEPGRSIVIKVRAKATDGDVRFFGDEAEPLERAIGGRDRRAARAPFAAASPTWTR